MRKLLALTMILMGTAAMAQITITHNDFPTANDTFRISVADDQNIDFLTTGSFQYWDYSALTPVSQRLDTFHAVDVAPAAYLFFFDNQVLYPEYVSDFALEGQGIDIAGQLTVSDVYDFYRLDSLAYKRVGFGARINGIPTPVRYDSIEHIYSFPIAYNNVDSSDFEFGLAVPTLGYYGGYGRRVNECDGWGSLVTPLGTFDALRIKTTITRTDSLYVDLVGFGFAIPRNSTEYNWYGANSGVPLLKITTIDLFGTETVQTIEYQDENRSITGVGELSSSAMEMALFPNPANGELVTVEFSRPAAGLLAVIDMQGKSVYHEFVATPNNTHTIDVSGLEAGTYVVQFYGPEGIGHEALIVR